MSAAGRGAATGAEPVGAAREPQCTVRRASAADAAVFLALEQAFPGDRLSARSVRHLLRSPSAAVFAAELEGRVVGNLILLTRRGSGVARLYTIAVAPSARHRGCAQRLLAAAESFTQSAGLRAIQLEVRSDNPAALALYEKRGYVRMQSLRGYYEDGGDGWRLGRDLR